MNETAYIEWFRKRYKRTSSFWTGILLMLFDSVGVMFSLCCTFFVINAIDHSFINFKSFITYSVYLPAFLFVFYAASLYPGIMQSPAEEVRKFGISTFCCFAGIAISIAVETDDRIAISIGLLSAIPVSTVLLPLEREIVRHFFSSFHFWGVPVVVYCDPAGNTELLDKLISRPAYGYKPAIILTTTPYPDSFYRDIPVFVDAESILATIKELNIKVAIIQESQSINKKTISILRIQNQFRYTIFVPLVQNIKTISLSVRDFGGIFGFSTTQDLTKRLNLFAKRCVDLFVLLIVSPFVIAVMIVLAVGVKCSSPGPVFFGHKRSGKNGKQFRAWKFRSMYIDAEAQLQKILAENPEMKKEWDKNRKFENDPRITKFGRFLRKTSLDELPQLFNVLIGSMSLVGPRPVTQDELSFYGESGKTIFSVKPGLSGLWQISGRSDTSYNDRVMLDTYYIQNWSVWLDIWILVKTVWVVFKGKGAY